MTKNNSRYRNLLSDNNILGFQQIIYLNYDNRLELRIRPFLIPIISLAIPFNSHPHTVCLTIKCMLEMIE